MAAQPKKKISHVRGATRRAHNAVKLSHFPACPNCRHPKPGHIACPECGFYGGKKILNTKTDKRIAQQLSKTKKEQAVAAKKAKKTPAKPKSKKEANKVSTVETKAEAKSKNTRTTDEVKASKVKNK